MVTLASIFNHMSSGGSKSTVLKPLFFALLFLLAGVYFSVKLELPNWVTYSFLTGIGIIFIMFIVVYLICLIKNPDLIRSEKFVIEKMAIERQFIGDNQTGIVNNTTVRVVAHPENNPRSLGGGDE